MTEAIHLYGQIMSPFVSRVVLVAHHLGVDLQPRPIPGGDTSSPEFRAVNPIGRVPALVHGDLWLAEGDVICSYLRDLYPDRDMERTDPALAARARLVGRVVDLYLMGSYVPLIPLRRQDNPDQKVIAEKIAAFRDGLDVVEKILSPGPFALGAQQTYADHALGPAVDYLMLMMPHFGIPDLTDGHPKLKACWQHIRDQQPYAALFRQAHAELRAYREQHGLPPLKELEGV